MSERGEIELHAAPGAIKGGLKVMHIAIELAWRPPRCYTLYQGQETTMYAVRRLWERTRDYEAVMRDGSESETPTVLIGSGTLADSFHDLWMQGKKIAIPLVGVEQMAGNDGSTFTVDWSGWEAHSQIKFWAHGPDEWKPLSHWIEQVIAACDNAIAAAARSDGDGAV